MLTFNPLPKSTDRAAGAFSRWLLLIVCAGQFLVVFSLTSVNIAVPTIARALSLSADHRVYIVSAYGVTLGSLLLLGGRIGDVFGRRRTLMGGTAVFTLGAAACTVAPTAAVLLVGRAVEGIGAALLAPASLATINAVYEEGRPRNAALATFAAVSSAAAGAGVVAGGVLTDLSSWRWVFGVVLPIAALLLVLAPRLIPETTGDGELRRLDLPGAASGTGAAAALVIAVTQAESWGFADPRTLGLLVAALAGGVAFAVLERRAEDPLLPPSAFRRRTLTSANGITFAVWASFAAAFLLIGLAVQQLLGYSPLQAGLTFVPMAIAAGVASRLAEAGSNGPLGPRRVAIAGFTLMTIGIVYLIGLGPSGRYLTAVLPALIPLGAGLSITLTSLNVIVFEGLDGEGAGVEAGLLNTSQEIGAALGVSIVATVAEQAATSFAHGHLQLGPRLQAVAAAHGFHWAFAVAGVIAAAGTLIAIATLPTIDAAKTTSRPEHSDAVEEPARPAPTEHRSGAPGAAALH
jgi:MFS family permease